jgi:hypothetical protein
MRLTRVSQLTALTVCGLILNPCLNQCQLFGQDAPPPDSLKIAVIEGEGFTNNVKKRTAREEIVEVRDRNNSPVPGAIVTFSLSSQGGAGGAFTANGSNLVTVTTNQAGRAVAMFKPNAVQGAFKMNISASFHGQTAATSLTQTNAIAAAGATGGAAGGVGGFIAAHAVVASVIAGAVVATTVTAVTVAGGSGKNAKVSVGAPTLP